MYLITNYRLALCKTQFTSFHTILTYEQFLTSTEKADNHQYRPEDIWQVARPVSAEPVPSKSFRPDMDE